MPPQAQWDREIPGVTWRCTTCSQEYSTMRSAQECNHMPVKEDPVINLLEMAKTIVGPFPALASEAGAIDLDEIINHLQGTVDECQALFGADDVCGLPSHSPIHNPSNSNHHKFVPRRHAGVAQSAEQGLRKTEVGGSIPSTSSKGFSSEQREIVKSIVNHQLGVVDNRKVLNEAKQGIKEAEATYKKAVETLTTRIKTCEKQVEYHEEHLIAAEDKLRKSIVNDLLLDAHKVQAVEPEQSPVDTGEDLGRAE